ncbi:FAD-dependent monooxygenase [Bacillus sp. B15-48]|uniref:FAD-dependent monooxygenase n=1 Tax=Bacillus sp. B15-48 TaxID=1548601 RepID=UPI00193F19C2|nr:FAD-dependent monooxygenase [Bacillus sp. B15-48]MBM4760942.1 FAD-binding protein [Bacillus sp. B15-48]
MELKADVCIVGAGPAGALLGYILAKNHLKTIVVERHDGIDKEFRGEHLNNDGEAILKKYHLYEKVETEGLLLMERIEYLQAGKVFKTVSPANGHQHVGIHVPQKNLLNVLIGESSHLQNYSIMMGTKLTELLTDKSGAVTGIKAKQGDNQIIINSSIVIGADGRFSTVRKLAEIPFTVRKHGYDLLWAKIPMPTGWEPTIKNALVEGKQLALFSQAGGFIQIGWSIPEGSYPNLKKQSFAPFIKRVTDAFPELTATVKQHIQSWDDFILLKVQSITCETWVKDGLAIIGDAAHTMSPTGAFGINSALMDADVLSEVILEAHRTEQYHSQQLKKFETARRSHVEELQNLQLKKEAEYKNEFAVPVMS